MDLIPELFGPELIEQVPKHYTLLGDGRLARHLAHYFGRRGLACRQWSRRLENSTGQTLEAALEGSDIAILAVSDPAIEQLVKIEGIGRLPDSPLLVHCSGSLFTERALGFHPLMSFGPRLYGRIVRIPFIAEKGRKRSILFTDCFPRFQTPSSSSSRASSPCITRFA